MSWGLLDSEEKWRYGGSVTSQAAKRWVRWTSPSGKQPAHPPSVCRGGSSNDSRTLQARVALSIFCLVPSNVLILDEPSNHLDVGAIAALQEALNDFPGTIIVISHDRPFCEALRPTHVAYVNEGKVKLEVTRVIPLVLPFGSMT